MSFRELTLNAVLRAIQLYSRQFTIDYFVASNHNCFELMLPIKEESASH